MGYTHYFQQTKEISQESWDNLCKDVKVVLKDQKQKGVKLATNSPATTIMVSKKKGYINFNGVGDDEHETFDISRKIDPEAWGFCKTARKPYDLAVTATLLLLAHHSPQHYSIGSDGHPDDWKEAAYLNNSLFGYAYKMPVSVAVKDTILANSIENNFNLEKELTEKNTNSIKPKI